MSNQTEDGWYPECADCGCGNLSAVVCVDCATKIRDNAFAAAQEEVLEKIEKIKDETINEISTIREDMSVSKFKVQMYHLIPIMFDKLKTHFTPVKTNMEEQDE